MKTIKSELFITEQLLQASDNDEILGSTTTITASIKISNKKVSKSNGSSATNKTIRSVKTLSSVLNTSASNRSSFSLNTSNRKITDYFQVRKSSRKCKSDLEKEKRLYIEDSIKNCIEEGLEVRNVDNKGRAIFATKYFKRGDFVCEYAGEMISYQLAKKREEAYGQDPSIGCYMYFFDYKSKIYCIDATAESERLGRLLNHSKTDGNCQTKLFEMNSRPYLILVAARDIRPGEEMLYDYGDRNKVSIESHPWLAK